MEFLKKIEGTKSLQHISTQSTAVWDRKMEDFGYFNLPSSEERTYDKVWNSVYLRMGLLQKKFTKVDIQGYKFKPHPFSAFEFQ